MDNGIRKPRCICGRHLKRKKNGQMGTTCGNPSCAGRKGKARMQEVLQTKDLNGFIIFHRSTLPVWR